MDMASEMDARNVGTYDEYQRTFAENERLRAEVDRLRGVVNDLGEMLGDVRKQRDAATARAEAAKKEVERLRGELRAAHEDNAMGAHSMANTTVEATARAEASEALVAGLRGALEEIGKKLDQYKTHQLGGVGGQTTQACIEATVYHRAPYSIRHDIYAALAITPASAGNRLKAEALRETANELENLRDHIQEHIGPDDARDDIRRICWNRAKDLRAEADRLEKGAANG